MQTRLVITVIGSDRPGLVERLATLIGQHDGNWLESRMSRLGGEFAGILRLSVPSARAEALRQALEQLAASGLSTLIRRDETVPEPRTQLAVLELVGQDRPGIVREIAAALAAQGANVEELETECVSAPMSGETLFKQHARIALPPGRDLAQLRAQLERIAADLLVDISLQPLPPP
jgi:glycine cleavage system regulatory protein